MKVRYLLVTVLALGIVFSSANASSRPKVRVLKDVVTTNKGEQKDPVAFAALITLTGIVPRLGASSIDVSISFDGSSINDEHMCALANTVPKFFSSATNGSFTANAIVTIFQHNSGATLNGVITGGALCFVDSIDNCQTYEVMINFAANSGSGGALANAHATGTLHAVVGSECPGDNSERIFHKEIVLWEFSK